MLARAVEYVRAAADALLTNDERRQWVVDSLKSTCHVSDHVAGLLVELAVFVAKHPGTVVDKPVAKHAD